MKQGTPEWHRERLGKITSSRYSDVLPNSRSKDGSLSKTAQSYLYELVAEQLTGQWVDVKCKQMDWGHLHEPRARGAYLWHRETELKEVGFVPHKEFSLVGGSPDGLAGEDGIVEIKCPFTSKVHTKTLVEGVMPAEHTAQVQGNLWVTDRKWCDFMSFDPRMPTPETQAVVIRVLRDEEFIKKLAEKVAEFEIRLLALVKKLGGPFERN